MRELASITSRSIKKIKEALSAAEIVILMLSQRSVARPWVNFEAGAVWLADKPIIPVCYGNLSKRALPHPYSAIQALDLPTEAYYLLKGVNHKLNLVEPISPAAVFRGTSFDSGAGNIGNDDPVVGTFGCNAQPATKQRREHNDRRHRRKVRRTLHAFSNVCNPWLQ